MNLDTVQMNSFAADQCLVPDTRNGVFEEAMSYELAYSYDELFPSLPENEMKPETPIPDMGQWNQKMKVKSSIITQVFHVPVEERKFRDLNSQRFGEQGEQAKICADIMQKTGAHIEISSSKDQSLTILVTGKEDAVCKAKRLTTIQLQTQTLGTITIPREHHRYVLGKGGRTLTDLQNNTATKIYVPRVDENSDVIKIIGTKDGIEKARHGIQTLSDEKAKSEKLIIPRIYHPFINGPHKETINLIISESGVRRINVPPVSVNSDELTIVGEKESIAIAKERIMQIFEEKQKQCRQISVEVPKYQHKYIIGPQGQSIQEILAETGISVEMPNADVPSDTIILRGEQEKLGQALTLVYEKASSVNVTYVKAPSWLHKFIIGKKGENITKFTESYENLHIEFNSQDGIKVEGPPIEVTDAHQRLKIIINDLLSMLKREEVSVDPAYHRHIVGKNGANIKKIKQDSDVQINIPTDNSCVISIEGCIEGVNKAKKELMEMVYRMENEVVKELKLEQKFHRTIIGSGGENIKATRDRFNQVNITFPEPGKNSDKVILRGPKEDVDACAQHLLQMHNELKLKNHCVEVPIDKQNHKFIIGKGGVNIKKIRDETNTKIDLPSEESNSDKIEIRGRKEDVLNAQKKILEIKKMLEGMVTVEIMIPAALHNSIIGNKGRLIRSITEDCGNVNIRFPTENCGSDKVSIRGTKEDVKKAKEALLSLSNEKQLTRYTEEIKAKPEQHKFLIGKNGANIKKVRERTGAKIIFPNPNDDDRDTITIIGRKEDVLAAKEELLATISELDQTVEVTIAVDPKHHRHFVSRGAEVVKQIGLEFGGVSVSFPRVNSNSNVVTLKGIDEKVEGARRKILEIVKELEQMITIECVIPQQYHRTIMGARGSKVQSLQSEYHVQIKFPEKDKNEDEGAEFNGDCPEVLEADNRRNIVLINGKADDCEAARQALLDLVPITEEIEVPFEWHRFIIGQKGKDVRNMMEEFDVNISIPHQSEESNIVKIAGSPISVENAKVALKKKIAQLEADRLDRELQNFQLSFEVDPQFHPMIIGRGGAVITKIKQANQVRIIFPERNATDQSTITVIGYENAAEAAKAAILKIVQEQEEMYHEEVSIDPRVHSRIIGTRGRNISRIMNEYHVDVRFPRGTSAKPDLVTISGAEEDVFEVKDKLLNMEEECLQDINDQEMLRTYTQPPSRKEFVVTGAPWDKNKAAPDTSNTEEFPSFGSNADAPSKPVAWGPFRR